MLKKLLAILALMAATFSLTACSANEPALKEQTGMIIEDARLVFDSGTGSYMVMALITNRVDKTVIFTGASTPAAESVSLQKLADGKLEVLAEGIEIHVGQAVPFSNEKLQLRLVNETRPISAGEEIEFTFEFEGSEPKTVLLAVE